MEFGQMLVHVRFQDLERIREVVQHEMDLRGVPLELVPNPLDILLQSGSGQ